MATAWLGEALPSPAAAIAAAGWTPDDPAVYCWRCGETTGAGEVDHRGCAACRRPGRSPVRRAPCDRVVRLSAYVDPMRSWIRNIKYGARWFEMGRTLGGRLGTAVARLEGATLVPARTIIVPMPMPWTRRLQRGIDHARVIAAGVGESAGWPVAPILKRRPSQPQAARARELRHRGGRGMRLRSGLDLRGVHVVLVDDVRTTGATLSAAARLLRRRGAARLVGAVLAVADPPVRRPPSDFAPFLQIDPPDALTGV